MAGGWTIPRSPRPWNRFRGSHLRSDSTLPITFQRSWNRSMKSFRLLIEICELPTVSRTDFVMVGLATLGNEIHEGEAVSAVLPHVRNSPANFGGGMIARFHADFRVREFALERLWKSSPPLVAIASVYGDDAEVAPLVLQRAAPLPTMFRRFIAKRASQRFDDEALSRVLRECNQETDGQAMTQATIGRSYAALAAPGEARPWTEVLRAQLHAIGPDLDDRRAAAFGGLLALGRIDVFAGENEGSDDEPLEIDLVGEFKDYAPVLELAAEQWEELEMAMGGFPISRLSRWNDEPAGVWRALVPYLSRSSRLRTRFLEYCDDGSVVLQAPALLALARLVGPGSSLLLDCCKRVLTVELDKQKRTPFDVAHANGGRFEVSGYALCRRRIGLRSDRCGERQPATTGRGRRWTGVALAGS